MEKMMLSLKNIYKLLMNNDFPIYSDSVISEADRKGQTMLRFWQNQLVTEFRCLPNGKMIWKNDGKRNRYTSHLCNRNMEMKCYTEYAMEIAAKVSVSSLLHQIACFTEFLQGRKHRHDVLIRRIREFVRLTEAEDLGVTKEIAEHIRESVEMPEWLKQCGVSGSLFQAAYLLTMLTLYAAAGEEMGSPALAVLRTKEYNMKSLWEEYTRGKEKAKDAVTFLTVQSGLLQDNPLSKHHFFGREEELFDLKEMVIGKRKCLISGIGGIGKTELLRQLICSCTEEHVVDKIAVVPYENGIVESMMRAFPAAYDLKPEESFAHILYGLNKEVESGKQVLLLIDNLNYDIKDDPELEKLLDLSCAILITTRRAQLEGFEVYRIQAPSVATGTLIFRDNYNHQLNRDDRQLLKKLLQDETLCHPMTLRLMARAAGSKNWSLIQLEESLQQSNSKLTWMEENRTVRFKQMYQQLYSLMKAPEACRGIAELFAILPRDSYSPKFLEEFFSEMISGATPLIQRLNLLAEAGWLDMDDSGYSMHPLIAQCLRKKAWTEMQLAPVLRKLQEQLLQVEFADIAVYENREYQRLCNIYIYICQFVSGNISCNLLVAFLNTMSVLVSSDQCLRRHQKLMEQLLRNCHEKNDLVEVSLCLAQRRMDYGDVEHFVNVYYKQKESLTISKKRYLDFCLYIGYYCGIKLPDAPAEEMLKEVLCDEASFYQKVTAYSCLASLCTTKVNPKEGLKWGQLGIDLVKRHPEYEDQRLLDNISMMALNYIQYGMQQEALGALCEMGRLLREDSYPMYKINYECVSGKYEMQFGQLNIALQHLEKAMEYILQYEGKGIFYITLTSDIAIVLQRMKRFKDAIEKYGIILEYARETGNHEMVKAYSNNIAVMYLDMEKPEEALRYLEEAFSLAKDQEGIPLAEILKNLARAYGLLGNEAEEYEYLKKASPMLDNGYGPKHPRSEAARQRLAELEGKIKIS